MIARRESTADRIASLRQILGDADQLAAIAVGSGGTIKRVRSVGEWMIRHAGDPQEQEITDKLVRDFMIKELLEVELSKGLLQQLSDDLLFESHRRLVRRAP